MRKKTPCYGCTDRNAECHGVCPAYLEFERENAKQRKSSYNEIDAYKQDGKSTYYHQMKNKLSYRSGGPK